MRLIHLPMFFQEKHKQAGMPTFFKESIDNGSKIHTIKKFELNEGQTFMPVIWSDRPYRSIVVDICEPITVVETYPFEKNGHKVKISGKYINPEIVARNDGLSLQDWYDWFEYGFNGYVICWKPAGYGTHQTDIQPIHGEQLLIL